jgi:hypothetical protein
MPTITVKLSEQEKDDLIIQLVTENRALLKTIIEFQCQMMEALTKQDSDRYVQLTDKMFSIYKEMYLKQLPNIP